MLETEIMTGKTTASCNKIQGTVTIHERTKTQVVPAFI